ncbi:hypothetical protein ACWGDT_35350 [Streptomyces avermitilis]
MPTRGAVRAAATGMRPVDRFLERAAAAEVAVRPPASYGTAPDDTVRLVPGYAHLPPARIRAGVRLLSDAVRD